MATLFPGANDSFSEPSAPSSTPLDSDGGSGRDMWEAHRDMGDAIMAMQAQATLLAHTHDGSTARHGSKLAQADTHQSADTDSDTTAIHHTIGTGANQGAAGNHSHGAVVVWPVGAIFITEVAGNPSGSPHNLPGTWTEITGRFLVCAGSTFTAGLTGGSDSHTHSATFGDSGGHSHTSPTSGASDSHAHSSGNVGSATFGHDHDFSNSTSASTGVASPGSGAGSYTIVLIHSHDTGLSNVTAHAHSVNNTSTDGSHSHTVANTDSEASHTHTSTINSAANINLPTYLVVYVWNRTA